MAALLIISAPNNAKPLSSSQLSILPERHLPHLCETQLLPLPNFLDLLLRHARLLLLDFCWFLLLLLLEGCLILFCLCVAFLQKGLHIICWGSLL